MSSGFRLPPAAVHSTGQGPVMEPSNPYAAGTGNDAGNPREGQMLSVNGVEHVDWFVGRGAGELWRSGVDDLAKYRIVEYLWREPHAVGDGRYFARKLGFHSDERTQNLLEELVEAGLIERRDCDGAPFYGLAGGEVVGRHLAEVFDRSGPSSDQYGSLFQNLAARSLSKTRALGRRRKR